MPTKPATIAKPAKHKTKGRVPLSIPLIQSKALELIGRDGLEALSMRTLAKELRVDPMAIYHHIPNKASLLSGIYESALAELFEGSASNLSWQEQLKALLRRFRYLATRQPNLFPGLIASSHTSPTIAKTIDAVLGILLEAGLKPTDTVKTGDAVFAFISGFVLLELNHNAASANDSTPQNPPPLPLANMERLREELQANQFAESFEFGLQFLITGIEANLPKPKKP
ncbi:MAG: TetR/AcrR family transcriptional regulator [Meiothermus sp.]|nr:TetR/AcrR family transcriptional regulator [Meiothermus sp.]